MFYKEDEDIKLVRVPDAVDESYKNVKVHLVPCNGHDTGITGFFSGKLLLTNFRYNEAYRISYEKDYGDNVIVTRSYLAIIVDSEDTVEYFRNFNEGGDKNE